MSRTAWAYVLCILGLGAALSLSALTLPPPTTEQWITLIVFLTLATCAQLFKVLGPTHDAYHLNLVFLFAGALLLPPNCYVLLVVIPHSVEWAKERLRRSSSLRHWYIQPFNMAVHIIAGWVTYVLITAPAQISYTSLAFVGLGMLAAVSYVFLNHLFIGWAILLARKKSWRESGVLNVPSVVTDLVLILLGFVVAVVWTVNPWLLLPALSPLFLMYRALAIPRLTRQAQTDEKTGLWNARHIMTLFQAEMERSKRFGRSLVVIIADLDLLRNINNSYGHLAGDAVLIGVAHIMQNNIRRYDLAGRFGGEEFCIVLPESSYEQAAVIAERLRVAVESAEFSVSTLNHPIRATLSMGVACFPSDAATVSDLIHQADVAVYSAKLKGRNRWTLAADVSGSMDDIFPPGGGRGDPQSLSPYIPRFGPAEPPASTRPARFAEVRPARNPNDGLRPAGFDLRYIFYANMVLLAGVLVAALSIAAGQSIHAAAMILLAGLAMATQWRPVRDAYGSYASSLVVAPVFAAALIQGVSGVIVVASVVLVIDIMQSERWIGDSLLQWGTLILAGLAPALAVRVVGQPMTLQTLHIYALPILAAALLYYAIDRWLMAGAVHLRGGGSAFTVWASWLPMWAPRYLALCFAGFLLGVVYGILGITGMALWVVSIIIVAVVQRQLLSDYTVLGGVREESID